MRWIVIGEDKGKICLVSKDTTPGMLPKGSFLTVEQNDMRFILRVEDSQQVAAYSPSPMIVDMDLTPLDHDRKCQNIIYAYRVCDLMEKQENQGLIEYIKPQSVARRSNQEEIDAALGNEGKNKGPKVFVATVQYNQNQLLNDEDGRFITASLPQDMFFHQMLICGKTGSGKTVAAKYFIQYFVEEMDGAVLAINVKDVDLLKMDKASTTNNERVKKEWGMLYNSPHPVQNYVIYYPANTEISATKGVTPEVCQKITLDVRELEPEALIGLLTKISDVGAMNLPNIFRYWQEREKTSQERESLRFSLFAEYFRNGINDRLDYVTRNSRGEESTVRLHRGTYDNISRNLDAAIEFFDNEGAKTLNERDILSNGKLSVIDVASEKGLQFGAILLRQLLHKIVEAKKDARSKVPILILIDEVHMFYNTDATSDALGDLDTICRTGRSQKIGVIFSSQNPEDMPQGLSSVINTKIFFRSDVKQAKTYGISLSGEEMEGLKCGYALTAIHDLPQLKIAKFPLSYSGVFE